ncbi:ribose operon repressor RbsR [Salinibacterium xinjiangense]|uniref:Transcriptional regulator, LacI family n=1 Tax=Salinibacterium xinjiangense TaxID=386302 RepID=A0A2C8ZA16_9MICO|nr:LacI family DNA-binding transcriptional regulator [Salinibacterium xinjiangense]GGK90760.1 ribose operon repressor RbsR [Salinibacterium xinjiangense]SOE60903.1 transcriptional regulator, LacI family [Salinibacterium xinjiangense]
MSALSDVARLAEVSKATVSRALSGNGYVSIETRNRVVAAAAAIGYVVSSNASSLVTGHTKNVGVVIPFINRWFFGEVLEGIETALIAAGYDLTLYRLSADDAARRRVFEYFLVRKRVDAVIAVGIELTRTEVDLLRSLGKPIVGIGGAVEGMATLSIDDVAAAELITELLIGLGHTRIMHVGGSQQKQVDFRVHSQRLKGFTQAMRSAGLRYDDESFRPTDISIEGGYTAGLSILADPRSRPSAIVAGADEVAIGIIIAARQLGIQVPAQLSVVGIDGHDLAPMFGLTTLAQHPKSQGTMAVRLLLDELTDLTEPLDRPASNWNTFPVSLEVRQSTTAPPLP